MPRRNCAMASSSSAIEASCSSSENGCWMRRRRATTVGCSADTRSEEHTSELQSLRHLVCRLPLVKKEARPKLHIEAVVAKVVGWLFIIVGALICVVVALAGIRGAFFFDIIPLMPALLITPLPPALPVMF